MRIRTIKPEFWSHPVMSRLSDQAKLLAIGLLNCADDDGFFIADPVLLRNALRPFDEDSSITRRALDECSRADWIEVRKTKPHGPIGLVLNFKKHQRIDRPSASKIAFYFNSTSARRTLDEDSTTEQGTGNEGTGIKGTEGAREALAVWSVQDKIELPEPMRTQECLEAVKTWLAYKRERGQTYKPKGLAIALAKWSRDIPPGDFPSAVEASIANNWVGLFPAGTQHTPRLIGTDTPADAAF